MMFKQIIRTGTLPYEIRDVNGFTLKKSQELKQVIIEELKHILNLLINNKILDKKYQNHKLLCQQ